MFKATKADSEERDHEHFFADGIKVEYNLASKVPIDMLFLVFPEPLFEAIEVSEMISPRAYGKYLDELQEHIDSLGDDADDWFIDERKMKEG